MITRTQVLKRKAGKKKAFTAVQAAWERYKSKTLTDEQLTRWYDEQEWMGFQAGFRAGQRHGKRALYQKFVKM